MQAFGKRYLDKRSLSLKIGAGWTSCLDHHRDCSKEVRTHDNPDQSHIACFVCASVDCILLRVRLDRPAAGVHHARGFLFHANGTPACRGLSRGSFD